LDESECQVHVIVTSVGRQLLLEELSITDLTADSIIGRASNNLHFPDNDDLFSPLASGSFAIDGMVICPCSSHSLAAIAAGLGDTLLLRSAYVNLKQKRPLILVHRENPLTAIDLENMLRITRAGGIICPASPAFYMEPETTSDLVDSVVGRVLDLVGVEHNLPIRWSP
jgi:4-hydroxy-3-polyprenylbenzoate decarboxylase